MSKAFGSNRSRLDIIANILRCCCPRSKKTHIMYRANLSYDSLIPYLSFVIERGLLEERRSKDDDVFYCTAQKGREYLDIYDALHKLISDEDSEKNIFKVQEAFLP